MASPQIKEAAYLQLILLKFRTSNQPKRMLCLLCFVDHASFRDERNGSVYVNELYDVLRTDCFDHHLADMLVTLNDKMGNLAAIKIKEVIENL